MTSLVARYRSGVQTLLTLTWADRFALLTLLTASMSKLFIEPAGKLSFSTIFGIAFVLVFLRELRSDGQQLRMPRRILVACLWLMGILATILVGTVNVQSDQEWVQFTKGLVTWIIHTGILVSLAWHCVRRGRTFHRRAVVAFIAGLAINGVYGILQFILVVGAGLNLDAFVVTPLTLGQGKDAGIHIFGAGIYRINGMMRDVNHLGVILAIPILYGLLMTRGRMQAAIVGSGIVALILTLSRSGLLGLGVGALTAAVLFRNRLQARQVLAGLIALAGALVILITWFPDLTESLIQSRLNLSGTSVRTHFGLYTLLPFFMAEAPLFGIGLNTFALSFAEYSGREGFGPHSLYVQVLVENGLIGAVAFFGFIIWTMKQLAPHPDALSRWFLVAFAATLAGNIFYLAAHIIVFEALIALALSHVILLGRHTPTPGSVESYPDPDEVPTS